MMGWHHSGMSWGPGLGGLLLLLLAIAVVITGTHVAIRLRPLSGRPGTQRPGPQQLAGAVESPEEILDRRFAAGEIDQDTYIAHRSELNAQRAEYPGRTSPPAGQALRA
jgi:putative membrane protein